MNIDGLSTVEGVADFLESDVLAAVPGELRGEVRAAVKLLRTSAAELCVRHREVGDEIEDLLELCTAHLRPEDTDVIARLCACAHEHGRNLLEQEALRADVHDLATRTMTRLVESGDPAVTAFLRCLGGHAARRSSWQSVFPASPANDLSAPGVLA